MKEKEAEVFLPLMEFELHTVKLHRVDSSLVQPEGRDETIEHLFNTILQSGWIAPPLLVRKGANQNTGRFEILDGHRRIACARRLELIELQCLVGESKTPIERAGMFVEANTATRLLMGNERIRSYCQIADRQIKEEVLARFSSRQAQQIRELERIFGEERLTELASNGKAIASVPACAKAVLSWGLGLGIDTPDERTIAEWIVTHKMSRTIDSAARNINRKTAQAIVNCIDKNVKYTRVM